MGEIFGVTNGSKIRIFGIGRNHHRLTVADHPEGVVVAGVEDEGAGPAVLGVRSEAGEKFRFGAREEWQKQRAILLAEGGIDPVHEGVDIDVGRHGTDNQGDDFCGQMAAGFAVRQWWEVLLEVEPSMTAAKSSVVTTASSRVLRERLGSMDCSMMVMM